MRSFSISIFSLFCALFSFQNELIAKNLRLNGGDFDPYQETLSKNEVKEKIERALQKDKEVENWYNLEDECLKIYSSPEDKEQQKPEFTLYFGTKTKPLYPLELFEGPKGPLQGLRVALDPGHLGGEMALLEEKYLHMKPNPGKRIEEEIWFNEGELALLTCQKLAKQLEALGAEVLLTRKEVGKAVYEKDFSTWLKEDFENALSLLISRQTDPILQKKEEHFWRNEARPTDLFKATYNFLDIEKRSELINAFNPHITISCHYNLGAGYSKEGYSIGTDQDYTLFFVPGAFDKGNLKDEKFRNSSLKSERSRYEFVRLLVTEDLEQSITLAQIGKKHAEQILKLPLRKSADLHDLKVTYPKESVGIYHRNLTLARLVHSPILYCEPLLQDNFLQAQSLWKNPSEKIDLVVKVYLNTILDWVKLQK